MAAAFPGWTSYAPSLRVRPAETHMKNIFFGLLSLALVVGAEQAHAEYDVEWSPDVLPDVRKLDDVSAAMDREGFAKYPLVLTDGQKEESVTACRRYLELKASDFAPATSPDALLEGSFIYRCQSLRFLASASKSPKTHLAREFTDRSAHELPACFGETSGDADSWRANNDRVLKGESLAAQQWDFVEIELFSMAFTAPTEFRSFKFLALGDVNGDGIEDALLASAAFRFDGSARKYETYRVTRVDPKKEVFAIMEQSGPSINSVVHGCPKTL